MRFRRIYGANVRDLLRKSLAVLSLSALLLASVPALAESISPTNLPACCNSIYCPMRHHRSGTPQQDNSICGMLGHTAQNDCSMQACDMSLNPAVGIALYVLVAPAAISYRAITEPAPIQISEFFSSHLNLPSTPPPRTLPS